MLEYRELKVIAVNEVNVTRKETRVLKVTIRMFWMYWLNIYRFNWRLEKMCFIKYHVSKDRSGIVELAGGVGTLRCVSAFHKPAWYFDAKFANGEGHEMTNVQKTTGHGNYLENSAYYCPYLHGLQDKKV